MAKSSHELFLRTTVPGVHTPSQTKPRTFIGSRLLRCRAAVPKTIEYQKKEEVSENIMVAALGMDVLSGAIPSLMFLANTAAL